MCRFLSHQVVTEMCLEIAQHVHKTVALANDIAEEIIISQVRILLLYNYVYLLHVCNMLMMCDRLLPTTKSAASLHC